MRSAVEHAAMVINLYELHGRYAGSEIRIGSVLYELQYPVCNICPDVILNVSGS